MIINPKLIGAKKLWENQNPSNTFESQTIILKNDNYDTLKIFYLRTYGSGNQDNQMMSTEIIKGYNGLLHSNWSGTTNATQMRMMTRNSDTSYTFSNAYQSGSVTNSIIIPMLIIGYKNGI